MKLTHKQKNIIKEIQNSYGYHNCSEEYVITEALESLERKLKEIYRPAPRVTEERYPREPSYIDKLFEEQAAQRQMSKNYDDAWKDY